MPHLQLNLHFVVVILFFFFSASYRIFTVWTFIRWISLILFSSTSVPKSNSLFACKNLKAFLNSDSQLFVILKLKIYFFICLHSGLYLCVGRTCTVGRPFHPSHFQILEVVSDKPDSVGLSVVILGDSRLSRYGTAPGCRIST